MDEDGRGGAEILHDGRDADSDGSARGIADGSDARPRTQYATNVEEQQPREKTACLRDDGGSDGDMHRQDRNSDTEQDAGERHGNICRPPTFRHCNGSELDRRTGWRQHHRQSHRGCTTVVAERPRGGLLKTQTEGRRSMATAILDRAQAHGNHHRYRRTEICDGEGCSRDSDRPLLYQRRRSPKDTTAVAQLSDAGHAHISFCIYGNQWRHINIRPEEQRKGSHPASHCSHQRPSERGSAGGSERMRKGGNRREDRDGRHICHRHRDSPTDRHLARQYPRRGTDNRTRLCRPQRR